MKRRLRFLAIAAASTILVMIAQTHWLSTNAAKAFKVDPVGALQIKPEGKGQYQAIGSGVYVGHGIVLTNWHVTTYAALLLWGKFDLPPEEQLLNYQVGGNGDSLVNRWICPVQPSPNSINNSDRQFKVSPMNTNSCVPYNLTQWQAFKPSTPNRDPLPLLPSIPLEKLLFVDRNMELAVVKVDQKNIKELEISSPCLSPVPVKRGDKLKIQSHAYGTYPAVSVTATVKDDKPMLRTDPDPRVPVANRYAAMSIVTTVAASESEFVGPGSSGAPVFNNKGEVVGLVWTGLDLANGDKEIWFTPTSTWLPLLEQNKIPDDDLDEVLDAKCSVK